MIVFGVIIAGGVFMMGMGMKEDSPKICLKPPVIELNMPHIETARQKELKGYKQINEDFLGLLSVGEVIKDEIIVTDHDNNTQYITTDFYTGEYASHGTSWLDYQNDLDDQNLIMYGHYVYPFRRKEGYPLCFTMLHELKDENNYEANKTVTLEMIGETRTYEVVYVYYFDQTDPKGRYIYPDYRDNEDGYTLDDLNEEVQELVFYDTGLVLTDEDRILSLQTCVEGNDDLRLIVMCRQTAVTCD